MKLGVVGLPNVGKSTLFNALTRAGAQAANYPFCTIEPNVGIVSVPDKRLDVLEEMYHPQKYTPATIEFVDIAGLVRGASRGEGLGNKFLSHIREVDAVIHVVRCFHDENVTHVDGEIDPARDIETINLELIFSDIETLEKRRDKARKLIKTGDKQFAVQAELMDRLISHLESGKPARTAQLTQDEKAVMDSCFLLTSKPVIYAANISEADIASEANEMVEGLKALAEKENSQVIVVSAKVEEELCELSDDEREAFLKELGISSSGLEKLIRVSYETLGLISFLTAGEKEVRAWTITKGMKAPQAAGKIHTDFEKGFIRAEVIAFDTLVEQGSIHTAKEKGLVRLEGKDYVVADGDVVLFRFNV